MKEFPKCSSLLLKQIGPHLHITLNRPDTRNALSEEMVQELLLVLEHIEGDRGVRSIILRGAGGTFCAGGDIKRFKANVDSQPPPTGKPDPVATRNQRFGEFLSRVNQLPQVVVSVVEGAAYGGGLGLICVSDVTLCLDDCRFALSETSLGVPPAQIAPFVVQRIGLTEARRLALTGARFSGTEAGPLGLINFVCADVDSLEQRLEQVLHDVGRCAPGAVAATKQILLGSSNQPGSEVLAQAARAFATALRGPEGHEGVAAFIEKRRPAWRPDHG
ncbi:MAG: enoyl-CoA hydratase/isomerase family protein [Ectothiorhodospiraceae bacterium]|nr:enoyl-CoA hydratase/isomerase family protein [Ectothiorhodospiraceae bacterium]